MLWLQHRAADLINAHKSCKHICSESKHLHIGSNCLNLLTLYKWCRAQLSTMIKVGCTQLFRIKSNTPFQNTKEQHYEVQQMNLVHFLLKLVSIHNPLLLQVPAGA